jgi:hypothetical protein
LPSALVFVGWHVRDALGQGAATTPYTFVPVRYPYGNFDAIGDGTAALDADPAFNASVSWAAWPLAMDGDGQANSNHMGDAGAVKLGEGLAAGMAETLRPRRAFRPASGRRPRRRRRRWCATTRPCSTARPTRAGSPTGSTRGGKG